MMLTENWHNLRQKCPIRSQNVPKPPPGGWGGRGDCRLPIADWGAARESRAVDNGTVEKTIPIHAREGGAVEQWSGG